MTDEQYDEAWADYEEQLLLEYQRFEEDKLKGPAKVVDFSIVYPDKEVKAIIIEAWKR